MILKQNAYDFLGIKKDEILYDVVILPVYFSDSQR